MSDATTLPDVTFHCPRLPAQQFHVVKMQGKEALSKLYRYEILLQVDTEHGLEDSVVNTLLGSPVYLQLDADGTHRVHGILSELEQLPYGDPHPVLYRAVLVPRLWRLTQRVGSWVYQGLALSAIVRGILTQAGFDADDDLECKLAVDPTPDYAVQYQEDDLTFLQRWMESTGIFYYFVQHAEREKLIVADQNSDFAKLGHDGALEFDAHPSDAEINSRLLSIAVTRRRTPRRLVLQDYDWTNPSLAPSGPATVDANTDADDALVYFGAAIDSVAITTLAQRRAEALAATREVFDCRSRVLGLAPGAYFDLSGHPADRYHGRFAITAVEHSVVQLPPQLAGAPTYAAREGFADLPTQSVPYENRFSAQRFAVPFRPARVTPRPRIHGTTLGRIDGATSVGMHAPTDVFGRYKVVMFYDQAPDSGGSASCWIRVAQRSSGPGYGDATRLHVGTEVLISYLDGDPDRPVIVGALANGLNYSPVTRTNGSQDVVRTRAGAEVVFEDDADEQLAAATTDATGAAHVTS